MAENLWALREQKKLSVATLASRAGLPIGLIMEYESGQRSIDIRHVARLARALYVEESAIRLQSEPRPGASPLERRPRAEERPTPPSARPTQAAPPGLRQRPARGPQPAPVSRPVALARPSQIAHLQDLLARIGRSQAEFEAQLGQPLAKLDRLSASKALALLQAEMRAGAGPDRHRAYLPEAVDQFEHRYLAAAQESGATLRFDLFNGTTLSGQVIGYSPYSITVRQADGSETTVNKLALVSYTRLPGGQEPTT